MPGVIKPLLTLSILSAVVALAASGCGGRTEHDATADYSPETIAQELVFRYKDLPENARKITSRPTKKAAPLSEKDLKKSGEATKEPPSDTADVLFDEIAAKVRALRGLNPAEAFQKVAEAVKVDGSLSDPDKQKIAQRLEEIAKEK